MKNLIIFLLFPLFSNAQLIMKKASPSEYRCSYMYSDSSVRGYVFNGSAVVFTKYNFGGLKAIDVSPAFNRTIILDQNHYSWITNEDQAATCTRFDTDTSGAAFNDLSRLYTYFGAFFSPSIDSTKLWAWSVSDSYKWLDGTGLRTYKPYVIWTAPGGRKIKKVACGRTLMILTTSGEVYERTSGASSFTQRTFTGTCVDIAASQNDFCLYVIHDYAGGDLTQGYPYWTKTESGFVGDVASRTEPFPLKTIWGLTQPIRAIVTNTNTYHFFDSTWRFFGGGDDAIGEVGDSVELVNNSTYTTPYSWTTNKCERCITPVQVAKGIDWTNGRLSSVGNSFTFYNGASDRYDTFYVTGRSKSFARINLTANNENPYPNALDITTFKRYNPLGNPSASYATFSLPVVHAGGNATITTTSTTIGGLDTAAQMANLYSIVNTQWTQTAGPVSAVFVNPNSSSTVVNGMTTNGTYTFRKQITDNNRGTWLGSVSITVNASVTQCTGCWIRHKTYNQKITLQ